MIYVYALAHGLRQAPGIPGIDDAPLTLRRCAGFDVVTSEHDAKTESTEEAVLAHARVVEAMMPLATALLPARFGLAFDDAAGLEAAVEERAGDLEASLERVRGRVELGVRVVGEQGEPRRASTGRDYLEARRDQLAEVDGLHDSLAARAEASTRGSSGGRLVLSGAYLVDPERIPTFREALEQLESEHPELTFALTGPWPPYSFAAVAE